MPPADQKPVDQIKDKTMPQTASGQVIAMFERVSRRIESDRERLSELDGPIGDADHGITMSLGFRAVCAALGGAGGTATPSELFRAAAGAFLDSVGASTGPLYATGLRCAAHKLDGRVDLGAAEQVLMLDGIAEGIAQRGKGQRGEKTMLDVWLPAAEAARRAAGEGLAGPALWREVRQAADAGAEATRSMIALRGRAARLGERSLGHLDPGAVSAAIIVGAMASIWGEDDAGDSAAL